MKNRDITESVVQLLACLVLLTGEFVNPAIAYICGILIVIVGVTQLRYIGRDELSFLVPLAGVFALGALISVGSVFSSDNTFIYLYGKDLWYYSKPVVLLMAGFYFFRFSISFNRVVSLLLFCSLAITLVSIIFLLVNVDFSNMSLDQIRFRYGSGNILPAITLAYIIHDKSYKPVIFGISIPRGLVIVILLSGLLMAFSRTIWGVFIIMLFAFNNYFTLKIKKAIASVFKLVIVITTFIILLALLNYRNDESTIVGQFVAKYSRSFEEISKNSEFSTYKQKMSHWRGYETLLVKREIKESGLIKRILGFGFGKTVYVGEDHFLGEENINIPKFHNGYSEIRLKTGIPGLVLYAGFFLWVFLGADNVRNRNMEINFLKGLLVVALFTSLVITGYYNKSVLDPVVLMTGYLISSANGGNRNFYSLIYREENKQNQL